MTPPAEELPKLLLEQKSLLISVATNGPRVKEKVEEYASRRSRILELLDRAGIQDPIPFTNLWQWYDRWNDGSLPTFDSRRIHIERIVQPLVDALTSGQAASFRRTGNPGRQQDVDLDVFISHSAKDRELAGHLASLLRNALNLSPERIRCTSVDGYRLEVGANSCERLREEAQQAHTLVALLTPNSLTSPFVYFELGARWGAGLYLAPLVAGGVSPGELRAPLSGMNVLQLASRAQVFQFLEDIARELKREVVSIAALESNIVGLTDLAGRSSTSELN